MNKIINGDSLKVLKKLEDESVDLVCTDPPYGYSFMGKDWDKVVPSVEIWKECLRVLKPGGFCFVMSAPRIDVQSRMGTKLEDAGFQTNFSPIYWTYATGFPKASNVGKMVDKKLGKKRKVVGKYKHPRSIEKGVEDKSWGKKSMKITLEGGAYGDDKRTLEEIQQRTAPASDEAKELEGSYVGYQPKPAVEVVLVCMKPIEEKSYIEQAMKNGKGVTWLDDCRIPYVNENDIIPQLRDNKRIVNSREMYGGTSYHKSKTKAVIGGNTDGRFAANLIVQDDILNDGKNRKGGTSNGDAKVGTKTNNAVTPLNRGTLISRNDEGSFSRFYDLDSWWKSQIHKLPESVQKTFPFMIVAKASKREKNEGLGEFEDKLPDTNDFKNLPAARSNSINTSSGKPRNVLPSKNNHPTVKPIELMSYLITLGSRDGDVVVDPFVGSGTTCIAAKLLNRQYIGIEKEEDYAIIAKTRVNDAENPTQASDKNKSKEFFAF